jgi:hypothetical protein
VHGSQSLIARADVITSVNFEMPEKADDAFEGKIAECETRDLAVLIGGSKLQEQTDRVAVAADRRGS